MKKRKSVRGFLEYYVVVLTICVAFFGTIVFFGVLTGNEWWLSIPDFSWDMLNTWSDIKQ